MNAGFWSGEKNLELIRLYEKQRILWDIKDKLHRNKQRRQEAFEEIATELGLDSSLEAKRKMESILAQYRREKKIETREKKKQWWGLKYLTFLDEKYVRDHPFLEFESQSKDENSVDSDGDHDKKVSMESSTYYKPTVSLSASHDTSQSKKKINQTEEMTTQCYVGIEGARSRDEHTVVDGDNDKNVSMESSTYYNQPVSFSTSHVTSQPKKKFHQSEEMTGQCYVGIEGARSRDEHAVYGETIANRLRKITNPKTLCIIKHQIDNLLFAAEMEIYSNQEESNCRSSADKQEEAPSCNGSGQNKRKNSNFLDHCVFGKI